PGDPRPALVLVAGELLTELPRRIESVGESDGIFERELGPRTDREVGGVRGVADQNDVLEMPTLEGDGRKLNPTRAIGEKLVSGELFGKESLAVADALIDAHAIEPGAAKALFVALDDHRARLGVELIGVDLKDAVFVLSKAEREGLEALTAPEPDVAAFPQVDRGTEDFRIAGAHLAVHPIRTHEEIDIAQSVDIIDFPVEDDLDTEAPRALLQNGEQRLAREAAKPVAPAADAAASVLDVDRVPIRESSCDGLVTL